MKRHPFIVHSCHGPSVAGLILVLILGTAGIISAAETVTNWLTLPQLLKKWEPVSIEQIQKDAANGDASAAHYLGYCNVAGLRVPPDPARGAVWYEQALKEGYLPSANNLGLLYARGLLGSVDLEKAVYYYSYATDHGYPRAQVSLGFLYQGQGRLDEAVQCFQRAAASGAGDAMAQLYLCYWEGKGVAADHAQAMQWLTAATDKDDPFAECIMGYRCESVDWEGQGASRHLTKPKLAEAFRWYQRSAEQKWAGGQYHLGLLYLAGETVELDEFRGLELIRAAADQKHEDAMIELAHLYARGVGEPRSEDEQPIKLLERAHVWNELMIRYEHGLGTPRDLVTAAHCFCKLVLTDSRDYSPSELVDKIEFHAPKRSWATPIIDTADRHLQILGAEDDLNPEDEILHVLSSYLKSATGDTQAAAQIANQYLSGKDAPKSNSLAWAWFNVSAQNGTSADHGKSTMLELQMTPEELRSARQQLAALQADLKEVAAVLPVNH